MVMGIDEAGQDDLPGEVQDDISRIRKFRRRTDLLDDAIAGEDRTVLDLSPFVVHRYENLGVPCQQSAHLLPPEFRR
jgi:hypothetical protein